MSIVHFISIHFYLVPGIIKSVMIVGAIYLPTSIVVSVNNLIRIKTSDGQVIQEELDVVKVSPLLKRALTRTKIKDPINLKRIDSKAFVKVMEWCSHHIGDPEVVEIIKPHELSSHKFSTWDEKWIWSLDEQNLIPVLAAAEYLKLNMLCNLGTQRLVADACECLMSSLMNGIMKKYQVPSHTKLPSIISEHFFSILGYRV